ncbi:MAG: Calpastatin [Candidatus Acidoferrum typicum]|nr:Calpastatin [Candidatus Acidoferrum typicum]
MKMSANDPYDLQRFVQAQSSCFERVCSELREGQKQSHWMWFVFPQLRGLGSSPLAVRYAISSREEAQAYLKNSILGPRLTHCTELVLTVEARSVKQIFGSPDDLKFRSSMTLFANVTSENMVFKDALQKYFAGEPDHLTIDRM